MSHVHIEILSIQTLNHGLCISHDFLCPHNLPHDEHGLSAS
jgi:hypothetical protein